jgi:hypothetical protein
MLLKNEIKKLKFQNKMRPNLSVVNNKTRPLRLYQKDAVMELESLRAKLHTTSKLAIMYFESDGGTGKDDMMYYYGQYSALPGKIMLLAPEVSMLEKVDTKWPKEFAPNFRNPKGFYTATLQAVFYTMKSFLNNKKLNSSQQELLDKIKKSGTIFVNEAHRLMKGVELQYIPVIRKGLEKLDQCFTVVNVSATIQDINTDAWGVPLEGHLVQTKNTDMWLNDTQVHTVLCGCKVVWNDVASSVGIDITKLTEGEQKFTKDIFENQILKSIEYDDLEGMRIDVQTYQDINKKLKDMHPHIREGLFTDTAIHLLRIATIEDIINLYIKDWGYDRNVLVYVFNNEEVNGKNFSYSKYARDYINKKAREDIATVYHGGIDRDDLRNIRENFESNKPPYRFVVCKSMLIEDFDKIDLRFLINCVPCNDPKSSRRKQKYMRTRRKLLTNPLDHTSNIKEISHIYQATNIKQIADKRNKYVESVLEALNLKKRFPNVTDPEMLKLIEKLIADAIKTKIAVVHRDDFDSDDITLPEHNINELDKILGGEDWETFRKKLKDETYTPPKTTVNLHQVVGVESGKCIVLKSKSWIDVYGDDYLTNEQYKEYMKKRLVLL